MTTNSINPKTGLPRHPAALCYWNTTGKRWIIQSRAQQLSTALRRIKGARRYGYAIMGGHLTLWAIDCTAAKAKGVIRGLTKILNDISAQSGAAKTKQEALLLSGRAGGAK
jgi:hypothetical protein